MDFILLTFQFDTGTALETQPWLTLLKMLQGGGKSSPLFDIITGQSIHSGDTSTALTEAATPIKKIHTSGLFYIFSW